MSETSPVFTIGVEAPQDSTEMAAVASASSYLAYADQSDTFGYNPTLLDLTYWERPDETGVVDITFKTPFLPSEEDRQRFKNEMDRLSRVLTLERVR
jgi:hypothetical protein